MKCRWFKPANLGAASTRAAFVDQMPPPGISGVYAIANLKGVCPYVGESHTGQLRKTMQRHLQIWNDARQPRASYDRHRVQVCWIKTSAAEALDIEADWIIELDPRDNLADPYEAGYPAQESDYDDEGAEVATGADEEVPF